MKIEEIKKAGSVERLIREIDNRILDLRNNNWGGIKSLGRFCRLDEAIGNGTVTEDSSPVLKWRMARGMNQAQAGEVLGVKYGIISEWELGKRKIPDDVLTKIGGASNG